jgi:hypothetical protein
MDKPQWLKRLMCRIVGHKLNEDGSVCLRCNLYFSLEKLMRIVLEKCHKELTRNILENNEYLKRLKSRVKPSL